MSRSYKHTPIYTVGGDKKFWKKQANKKVRNTFGIGMKSNNYKKIYESWHIIDYRFYLEEDSFRNSCGKMQWAKFYYRK